MLKKIFDFLIAVWPTIPLLFQCIIILFFLIIVYLIATKKFLKWYRRFIYWIKWRERKEERLQAEKKTEETIEPEYDEFFVKIDDLLAFGIKNYDFGSKQHNFLFYKTMNIQFLTIQKNLKKLATEENINLITKKKYNQKVKDQLRDTICEMTTSLKLELGDELYNYVTIEMRRKTQTLIQATIDNIYFELDNRKNDVTNIEILSKIIKIVNISTRAHLTYIEHDFRNINGQLISLIEKKYGEIK
jgi:hypothetical protein